MKIFVESFLVAAESLFGNSNQISEVDPSRDMDEGQAVVELDQEAPGTLEERV